MESTKNDSVTDVTKMNEGELSDKIAACWPTGSYCTLTVIHEWSGWVWFKSSDIVIVYFLKFFTYINSDTKTLDYMKINCSVLNSFS